MRDKGIQIVSNEAGDPTAVIVPIELWREIASERETAYLLKSETMKQRLLASAQRRDGLPLDAVIEKAWNVRSVEFDASGHLWNTAGARLFA